MIEQSSTQHSESAKEKELLEEELRQLGNTYADALSVMQGVVVNLGVREKERGRVRV